MAVHQGKRSRCLTIWVVDWPSWAIISGIMHMYISCIWGVAMLYLIFWILCTGLPITTYLAGQWLNSLIFHCYIKCNTANRQTVIYVWASYISHVAIIHFAQRIFGRCRVILNVHLQLYITLFWYQILLSSICSCIHFQVWFYMYFTWPHLFTLKVLLHEILIYLKPCIISYNQFYNWLH